MGRGRSGHHLDRPGPPEYQSRDGGALARHTAAEVRTGRACLLLQGALDSAAGHQADAVASLREAVVGYTEAGDLNGMWLARFALADPLFVTGGIEEVIELADGFDAGLRSPRLRHRRWPSIGGRAGCAGQGARVRRAVAPARSASPFRRGPAAARRVGVLHPPPVGSFRRAAASRRSAIREFKRSDPFNRLAVVSAVLPFALADQGRDAEALAGWRDVEERAIEARSGAMLKVEPGVAGPASRPPR